MTTSQTSLDGIYYDGRQPIGVTARLNISTSEVMLTGLENPHHYPLPGLRVSPRIAKSNRSINFPDGGQFQCADSIILDRFAQESAEGWLAWLEANVAVALLGIGVVIAILLLGYFYGLPKAAEYITTHIPIEIERAIGEKGLVWMEQNQWLRPTKLEKDTQTLLRDRFTALYQGLAQAPHYRLEFRNAPPFGANAFALPGGTIVITDALVNLAESRDELLAVLAHEIGHVERRHTLRLALQNSVVALAAATVTGDAATLGVAAVPAVLAQTQYSREFESEADEFAFTLLRQHNISPDKFADIMIRMSRSKQNAIENEPISFLSTHPLTQNRIERARAAALQ